VPEDYRDLASGLLYLGESVNEVRDYTRALSRGDLNDVPLAKGNELASGLKSLSASLAHLTWQMQQVAKGDYSQRVSFMGEFSEAVNDMVQQLDERQRKLVAEVEANKKKSEALAQSNSLFEAITEGLSQWIVMVDRDTGEWLFTNHDIAAGLHSMETEPQLRCWINHQAQMDRGSIAPNETDKDEEVRLVDSNGTAQYIQASLYRINWHEHDTIAFVCSDVTAEKQRLNNLENIAYHDTLTNTFNRHYGMGMLSDWLASHETFILCFIDMDNLKFVNDQFGHAEGDNYILNVTALLKRFAPSVIICRLGGDEFMLLCKDWTLKAAEARLEELRSELLSYKSENANYKQSLSFGVIEANASNTLPASDLLTMADEKMYAYKRAHKAERRN
jgi:diguanylate cyclase (GGDEF)-like protein